MTRPPSLAARPQTASGNASPPPNRRNTTSPRTYRTSPYKLFACVGIVAAGLAAWALGKLTGLSWPWACLAGINFGCILLFGYDKFAAGHGFLRVPERVLHGFVLFGGTPGGYLAQRWFRHKVAKTPFRQVFWALAALQFAIVGLLWYCFAR